MSRSLLAMLAIGCAVLCGSRAHAHVSAKVLGQGPVLAGKSYQVELFVPHGCSDAQGALDTYKVELVLPPEVNPMPAAGGHDAPPRPMDSSFGRAQRVVNQDRSTTITWTRSLDEVHEQDSHFHKFTVYVTMPDAPFSTLYLPVTQTCRRGETDVVAAWTAKGGDHTGHDSPSAENPAPSLFVWPKDRMLGWNKWTAPDHLHDFKIFSDAQIVWAGEAAYSPNPNTQTLIKAEGLELLSAIHPGTEFWVKF